MVDVLFRFEKEGYETVEKEKTVHEKGKFQVFLPTRIWVDSSFEINVQDGDGLPVEGVSIYVGDFLVGTTDNNGKASLLLTKDIIE